MAILTLDASGAVTTWSGTPSIVGSSPQWGDGSDSTYAQMTTFGNGADPFSSKRQDIAYASLDQPPEEFGDPDQITLISMTARMRYKATVSAGTGAGVGGVIIGTPGLDLDTPGLDLDLTADNAIHDLTHLWTESDYTGNSVTLLSMVQQMADGDPVLCRANMSFGSNITRNLWVYEFALDIEYELVATPGKPILRVYPREDGRGSSSAARIYPPPRSRQGSNRVVGGYE